MKNLIKLLSILFLFGAVFMSCEGPEGPEGPAGADGADGADGINGVDGVDANSFCVDCHTTAKWTAITTEFESHKHSAGTTFGYAGTRSSCAPCHSSSAIIEYAKTGTMIAGTGDAFDCGTCHVNHGTLEEENIVAPIRDMDAVASIAVEGATYEHGAGNLCATCHQARRIASDEYVDKDTTYTRKFTGDDIATYTNAAVGPAGSTTLDESGTVDTLVVVFDVPAANEYISSTHVGPHHGPQANMFAADMGSVTGTPFTRDHHTDCASCHLSDATAEAGYGHNFAPDVAACDDCHGAALDLAAEQEAISTRLDAIATALEAIHAIHVDEDGVPHPTYASLTKAQYDAFWNFMCVYEDQSYGVHNPGYANQLLTQAEDALSL